MPFSHLEGASWDIDPAIMRELPGGRDLEDWFGFATTFHDCVVESANFTQSSALLVIDAFRITSQIDDRGYYILDRRSKVTISLEGFSAISIQGTFPTAVLELGFRVANQEIHLPKNSLAQLGDMELGFDDIYGGGGSIFAKTATISFLPIEDCR